MSNTETIQIKFIGKDLDRFITKIVKKLTLDIVANLVRAPGEGGTPVDTGWARSNWIARIGKPMEAAVGTREAVGTFEQESSVAVVATQYKKGEVHITNNVPYIINLNEGSSKQAPAGFVQTAIWEAIKGLKG